MADILYPSKNRRLMSVVAGLRRYHRNAVRASTAARGGVLWVALGNGWSCNPDRVGVVLTICEKQERQECERRSQILYLIM